MSGVDLALLGAALVFLAVGLYTGVVRVLMALLGLASGLWVAWRFGPPLAEWSRAWLPLEPAASRLLASGVLLATSLLLAAALTWLLARALGVFRLGWADRALGGLLGLLIVLAGAGFVAVQLGIDAAGERSIGDSRLLPLLVEAAERLGLVATPEAQAVAEPPLATPRMSA